MLVNEAYSVLQLNSGATMDDVKKAFRKLGKLYHPDSPHGDADKFKQLKNAKTIVEADIKFGKLLSHDKRSTYIVNFEDFISNKKSSTMKLITGELVETKQLFKNTIYLVFNVTIKVRMVKDGTEVVEEYTNEIFKEHRVEGRYEIYTQIEIDKNDLFKEKDMSVEVLGVNSSMRIKNTGVFYLKVADNSIYVTVDCKSIKNENNNSI